MLEDGLEPASNSFETFLVSQVKGNNHCISISIELVSHVLKAVLPRSVPQLDIEFGLAIARCMFSTNGIEADRANMLLVELASIVPIEDTSFPDRSISNNND